MNKLFRLFFWISVLYIGLSLIGYIVIVIFRPDITVAQTVPFMVALFTGILVSGLLGEYFYGKKK